MNPIQITAAPQDIFLKNLREGTAESHTALENNSISKALLSEEVSLQDYQIYLEKMYGLVKGIENDVYPVVKDIFPDLQLRKKAFLIETDLRNTGYSAEQFSLIPVKHFITDGTDKATGMMYVLEGSSLGGRVLYKHVNKYLGLTESIGASFFAGYGDRTGPMWKAFLKHFTDHAVNTGSQQSIIDAASQTFREAGEWLSA